MAELTFAEISKLLKYDPETGKLFWLPRTPDMFQSDTTFYGGVEAKANNWNSRCAGKEIVTLQLGYVVVRTYRKHYPGHRICWLLYYGEWPKHHIDHINGVKTDNRIENLRDVPRGENMQNMRLQKRNRTGTPGVGWCKIYNKWKVRIGIGGGKSHFIGYFLEFDDAVSARKKAEIVYGYHPNHGRLEEASE
jgi:hypothetical protein